MRIPDENGRLGKYDSQAEKALLDTHADCVVLMVIGGDNGNGLSVSSTRKDDDHLLDCIPDVLSNMAARLRAMRNNTKRCQ